jgi:recombination protein RecA
MIEKILADLQKDLGDRAFLASEAPNVKIISSGIMSLDIATGVGGWPRGTLVEIFGRESSGKTAMTLHTMAQVHKNNGFTALINLESGITKEGWLDWATSIAPPGFDPKRLVIVNANPGTEALTMFGKMIASGGFDVIVYDSIGAMSTDKELEVGEKKQSYGQSALVTQLIKQAAHFAYTKQCVPIMLNQIRDQAAGTFVLEKAPGGHAKDHFATLRVHLKTTNKGFKRIKMPYADTDDPDEYPGFRVGARLIKNKVGAPRRSASWNYWNYQSPDGVLGIDIFQDAVDCALRYGAVRKTGSWFQSDDFPDGKLHGGDKVVDFFRAHPELFEKIRRDLVMQAFNKQGNIMEEERETLVDDIG